MSESRQARLIVRSLKIILLPVLAFVLVTVRMLLQDVELSRNRQAEERNRDTEAIQRDLLALLEGLKYREGARLSTDASPGPSPPVIFTARVRGNSLSLPWDAVQKPSTKPFLQLAEQAESAEFMSSDSGCDAWLRALKAAAQPVEQARARMGAVRTCRAADQHLAWLLASAPELTDEFGVPWRLYAIGRVAAQSGRRESLIQNLEELTATTALLSPAAVYMIKDLAHSLGDRQLKDRVAAAHERTQAAADLNERFSALFPNDSAAQKRWVPANGGKWLAGLLRQSGDSGILLVVDGGPVLREVIANRPGVNARLVNASQPGMWLGSEFPGVRLSVDFAAPGPTGAATRYAMAIAAVLLVVTLAVFSGLLAYRDVQRDIQLAELRGRFVSSVTHELRTPLTSIRMFAELLQLGRARTEEKKQEYLETIVQESERLSRIVENVLLFSRIERGEKAYNLQPVAPADLAQSAARAMEYPMSQQGFELKLSIEEDVPAVMADRDAMMQAILNLLGNAVKYAGTSRTVEMRVRADVGRALIEVEDRGIGIPPEDQPHIFEKFYRVQETAHRAVPGTGIGLALVDQIVRAHRGEVRVASKPGEGSTFTISMPAVAV